MNENKMKDLVGWLYRLGCIRFGEFTMKSGQKSPIYVDLRRLISNPDVLDDVAITMIELMMGKDIRFERIAGIPLGGLPIATVISLRIKVPMIYPRSEVKDHGTRQQIEGNYNSGENVLLIDDLITQGNSKIEAIEILEAAGLKVSDVLVLVDREQGGAADLASRGYKLHSVTTLRKILEVLREQKTISEEQYAEVMTYLGVQ